jgi:hypothetical protein
MTDAEERLRGWLERRAELAPRGQFMLDRVREESARRTRRRRVALAGGLAVAVVMLVVGVITVTGRSTRVSPPVTGDTGVTFVAGARVAALFPLQISITPADATPVATLVAGHPTLVLSWFGTPLAPVTITVGTAPPPADAKPVKLGVDSAAMAWNGAQRSDGFTVWWIPPTGGWATLTAPPDFPLRLIAKVASGLRPGSMPGAEPFTFATVPRGFVADNIDATHVTFGPPGSAPDPGDAGKILVRLDRGPLTGAGQQVTLAGRPALLSTTGTATVLRVADGASRTLSVRVPSTIHVARADLLRFAAGIRSTGS